MNIQTGNTYTCTKTNTNGKYIHLYKNLYKREIHTLVQKPIQTGHFKYIHLYKNLYKREIHTLVQKLYKREIHTLVQKP